MPDDIAGGEDTKEYGVEKFRILFRRALAIGPGMWKQAAESVWKYCRNDRVLLGIVPDGDVETEKKF